MRFHLIIIKRGQGRERKSTTLQAIHNTSLHEACIVLRRSDPPSYVIRSNFGIRSSPLAPPASALPNNSSAFPPFSHPSAYSSSQFLETSKTISGNMQLPTRKSQNLSDIPVGYSQPSSQISHNPRLLQNRTKTVTRISQPQTPPPSCPSTNILPTRTDAINHSND